MRCLLNSIEFRNNGMSECQAWACATHCWDIREGLSSGHLGPFLREFIPILEWESFWWCHSTSEPIWTQYAFSLPCRIIPCSMWSIHLSQRFVNHKSVMLFRLQYSRYECPWHAEAPNILDFQVRNMWNHENPMVRAVLTWGRIP